MPASLPQEAIVRILDSLFQDRQTLSNCALVCRQWRIPCRYNLFYRLAISHRASFELLVHIRDEPHIAHAFDNVRSLQLWDDKDKPWIHLFTDMFYRRLPQMHFLTLGDFMWDILPLDPSFGATGTRFPAVTTLKLANGRFHSFGDFRRLVCSFTQLIHLYVENVEWRAMTNAYGATSVDPGLHLLWFKSHSKNAISELVDWLVASPSTDTLSDIQIWEQYSDDLPEVQRLTKAVGPKLEHFQVSLQFWTRDKRLDLFANTSLKTLHVRDIDSSSCQHLPFLLDHLSPGSLQDLSLYLHIPTLDDLGVLRGLWGDVADILARDAFALLPMVTIWLVQVPPAAAISTADLAGELKSWTPLDPERTYLRVFPLLAFDG